MRVSNFVRPYNNSLQALHSNEFTASCLPDTVKVTASMVRHLYPNPNPSRARDGVRHLIARHWQGFRAQETVG